MSTYDSSTTPDLGGEQPRPILRLSPLQRELRQWFERHAPALAEPYLAALTLMQGHAFPGRGNLVCFCMRDLGNILPRARNVDNVADNATATNATQTTNADNLSGAKKKARLLLQALPQYDLSDEEALNWIDEVHTLMKWFSDRHHFSHKQRQGPSDEDLRRQIDRFERALLRFTHTFFGLLKRAEEIIEGVTARGGAPTESEADHLVAILEWSPEFQRPLFDRLSRDWLQALRERKALVDPPIANYWPASKFLARIASVSSAEVAAIFAGIDSDNMYVVGDMLDAAKAMPIDDVESLVPVMCRAANGKTLWFHFDDAGDLCVRLAQGYKLDAAMGLAEALFTPVFDKGQEEPNRRDEHWYKKGLTEVVPVLAKARPHRFMAMLCEWLKASVEAKRHFDSTSSSDYSYVWRPAIEEHAQNGGHDFAGSMVGFVRKGFEEAIRSGNLSLDDAFQVIEPYPYLVFKRLRLHLIGEFAVQNIDLAHQTILSRELFDDYKFKHEYAVLVGRRFDLLSSEQRDEWFAWIDAGPDMSDFDASVKRNLDRDATDEDRMARVQYWQFEKLHWVRNHLQGDRRKLYEQMLALEGEPEHADLNVRMRAGRWGDESPMTVDQLSTVTFEEAVDAVSSWKPGESRFMGPSIDGLASTFGQYVATKPAEFSAMARILVDRPAIFVRHFVRQMGEAVKAGSEIDLLPVIELCRWVLDRPIEEQTTPVQPVDGMVDRSWQWTRDEVSQFVQNVCKAKSGESRRYPLDGLREKFWELIDRLCSDQNQSYVVRDTSKEDPRVHDYLELGINSPRGKAVEAALEYARWVAQQIERVDGEQKIVPGGFDAMPEVREMLEWHIAAGNRSFEVMSIIGSQLGLIYSIDKKWLTDNAGQLFQLDDFERTPDAAYGWAAWNAFLVWGMPHKEYYRLFRSQFAYAIEQTASVKLPEHSREQPMHRLGEHLMILYGGGHLALAEDDRLFRRFLEIATPEIRRHSIGFVGQSLEESEKLPEDIITRFMSLWDQYWKTSGKEDAKGKPDAWLFGTWFTCGQFPEEWAIDCLEQFVDVVLTPEPDHAVAEKLADMAHIDIARAVRILDRVVRGDREGWRLAVWRDSAKRILQLAVKTTGDARERAVGLIDYLGRRGYVEFGELLHEPPLGQ